MKETLKTLKAENKRLKKESEDLKIKSILSFSSTTRIENHKNSLEEIKADYIESYKHMRQSEKTRLEQTGSSIQLIEIGLKAIVLFFEAEISKANKKEAK